MPLQVLSLRRLVCLGLGFVGRIYQTLALPIPTEDPEACPMPTFPLIFLGEWTLLFQLGNAVHLRSVRCIGPPPKSDIPHILEHTKVWELLGRPWK